MSTAHKILVVEDEASIRDIYSRVLCAMGKEVLAVATAEEAVKICLNGEGGKLNLILTDLKLPGMDGLEFLEKIRREGVGIPAILISGNYFDKFHEIEKAQKEGLLGFHAKPITPSRLSEIVRAALDNIPLDCLQEQSPFKPH